MANTPTRWHLEAPIAAGLLGLPFGPVALFVGARATDHGNAISGSIMLAAGALMVLGGGLTLFGVVRRKPPT